MNFKIISDSCIDYSQKLFESIGDIEKIPFKINIDGKEYDDEKGIVRGILESLEFKAKKITTSCPSPDEFYRAMVEAKNAFIVTISSNLSGSYSAAMNAKQMLEEELGKKLDIHVFDSKSAATGESLIALKIKELMDLNLDYDQIVQTTNDYIKKMRTVFSLESLDTLVSNGRVSLAKNLTCKALKLFPILQADQEGRIVMRTVARGSKNAVQKIIDSIAEDSDDLKDRVLGITHINAMEKAQEIKNAALERYNFKDIMIFEGSGLSSVYASNKGVIIAY